MTAHLEQELARYFARAEQAGCDRELDLCRHVAGQLRDDGARSFKVHLQACEECRENLTALRSLPSGEFASKPAPRERPRRFSTGRLPWALVLTAAALLLLVYTISAPGTGTSRPALVAKGPLVLHLQVAVNRDGRTFRVSDGARLRSGDRLGFFYSASTPTHLTILFVDHAGEVSRLFPALEELSAPVLEGTDVPLPDGAVLSGADGCEWVVGLFSKAPLHAEVARKAARRMWESRSGCALGSLALEGVEVRVTRIEP